MVYTIEPESFDGLEKAWRKLLSVCSTNHIFLTPQWQKAWWQTFGNGSELMLLSVYGDTELIGIVPLMRRGKTISFVGSSDVCDYMDFIVHRGQEVTVFSHLLDYLEPMEWDAIELRSLLPDSLVLSHFAPLAKQLNYLVEVTKEDVSLQLVLPSSWEKYLSKLEGKDRRELRRKLRRLDQTKSTRFYTITEKEQIHQSLEDFFELFKLSGDAKAGFMTNQMRCFFNTMAYYLAEEGNIRLSFLDVGGVRVASTICFDYEHEFYLYNSGYNPEYASFSVGLILKVFCLRDGIFESKKRFDFLRGAEPYKYDLGGHDIPISRCVIRRS
jgi:CelD/BcsL family acetyltransferase involved in cellulose biosynthesis